MKGENTPRTVEYHSLTVNGGIHEVEHLLNRWAQYGWECGYIYVHRGVHEVMLERPWKQKETLVDGQTELKEAWENQRETIRKLNKQSFDAQKQIRELEEQSRNLQGIVSSLQERVREKHQDAERFYEERGKALNDRDQLVQALQTIESWFGEFPPTGQYWDDDRQEPMSYSAAYGSNGERDYMRGVARLALLRVGEKLKGGDDGTGGETENGEGAS